MELKNCRNCKRLFNYITGDPLCGGCKNKLEDVFNVVKQYIRDNPGSNVEQVAEACEISPKQIRRWVREERLTFTDDSLVGLECERCGRMIHSGRFCAECAGGLEKAFNQAYAYKVEKTPKGSTAGKMRFLE